MSNTSPMPEAQTVPAGGGLALLQTPVELGATRSPRTLETAQLPRAKRALDVALALILLSIVLPVLVVAIAAVRLYDGGPAFFRQRRVGYGGRAFEILKLRTMVEGAERWLPALVERNDADGLLFKMWHDPRITSVGRVLRRLSIDELPQLVNVLRGQMSLVGPRPLPVDPESFGDLDGMRHSVRPGITGPWQVLPDERLGYEQMIHLDLGYVRQWSLRLDLLLLARTVPAVLRRRGPS